MPDVKDTKRAWVRIGYDGRVHKQFRGHQARARYENEVAVLKHLAEQKCPFVPVLLGEDAEDLVIVTTNCGKRAQHLTKRRADELFAELETFGVRHNDPFPRNITYRASDGRFCVIDFEFATLLDNPSVSLTPEESDRRPASDDAPA